VTRKQILLVVVIVIVASTLSALVAYRRALRKMPQVPTTALTEEPGCVNFQDVAPHVGESGCVTGRVLRVYTSRAGHTFLDFCSDYHHCPFASVVFSSDRNKFGKLSALEGRVVEIRGAITVYEGRAEIIIRDPDQIKSAP
jgi:hypothetical protein